MKLSTINHIEHPNFAADGARITFDENTPQVPEDPRDEWSVPCILTRSRALAERRLALLQASMLLSQLLLPPHRSLSNEADEQSSSLS